MVTITQPQKKLSPCKINKAFQAVNETPMNALAFSQLYNVSMHVLRQASRFDKTGNPKKAYCRLINKQLMIWRE